MAELPCALILSIGICNLFVTKYDLKLNTKVFIIAAIKGIFSINIKNSLKPIF